MDNEKKINVLFDAEVIAKGAGKGSNRSGIFFTSLQIALQLVQNESLNFNLYCPVELQETLKKENYFDKNINLYPKVNYFEKLRSKYLYRKNKAKRNKKIIKKIFYKIIVLTLKLLVRKKQELPKNENYCYLSPAFNIPDCILKTRYKLFVILYDVIPIKFSKYNPAFQNEEFWFNKLTKQLEEYNINAFAISESTKNDFLKYLPDIKNKIIKTIPLATAEYICRNVGLEDFEKVKIKYHIPDNKKYIFSLCSIEPRKNLIRIIKSFVEFVHKHNITDIIFVVGGGHWKEFYTEFCRSIDKLPKELIVQIGYVDDEDLSILYSNAEWFVYTSQYEGFGLPPLEAMKCGCPVITSNNSSLPEVVRDNGIMINWDSDDEHVSAYEKYYFDKDYREKCAMRGYKYAKEFSWKTTANIVAKEMIRTTYE